MQNLMREAFSTCYVQDKTIRFLKQYSDEDLMKIYNQFSTDLLKSNIPNWRIIGFWHQWDKTKFHSVFTSHCNFNQSLIELGMKLNDIIPTANGGNDTERGAFYSDADTDVIVCPEFEERFGYLKDSHARKPKANQLKLSKEIIGSIMCSQSRPPHSEKVTALTTETVWYTQYSFEEACKIPKLLVRDKYICDIIRRIGSDNSDPDIIMFIKRGTGDLSYEETQEFFVEGDDRIMPCNVSYGLYKYFTCAVPEKGIPRLPLIYHERNINEDALTTILQEYGKEWEPK